MLLPKIQLKNDANKLFITYISHILNGIWLDNVINLIQSNTKTPIQILFKEKCRLKRSSNIIRIISTRKEVKYDRNMIARVIGGRKINCVILDT